MAVGVAGGAFCKMSSQRCLFFGDEVVASFEVYQVSCV
jgi:hypothetical protein